jgi:serine phosphatase RsbU (regulator of sigma subunit)/lipopolysaccharide biosynthesis regulator YciM
LKVRIAILLLLSGLLYASETSAKKANLDSLFSAWNNTNLHDTLRIQAHHTYVIKSALYSNPDTAYIMAEEERKFAEQIGSKKLQAEAIYLKGITFHLRGMFTEALDEYAICLKIYEELKLNGGITRVLNNYGIIYNIQGEVEKAIAVHERGLKLSTDIGNRLGIASSCNNLALIYQTEGDLSKAIELFTKALKLYEEVENQKGASRALGNIGLIYLDMADYDGALDFFNRSLALKKEIGDELGMSSTLNNMGGLYQYKKEHNKALEYFQRSLKLRLKLNDQKGLTESYGNVGVIQQGIAEKATSDSIRTHYINLSLENNFKALEISQKIKNKIGEVSSLYNIGNLYKLSNDPTKAASYGQQAFKIAQEIGSVPDTRNAAELMYRLLKEKGGYKSALEMHELYIELRDSLKNEENQREVLHQQFQYDYEKQEALDAAANQSKLDKQEAAAKAEKERQKAITDADKKRQNIIITATGAGLALVLIFAVFMVQRFRVTRKQKDIIELQKEIVEEKNQEILDSINYAKRIQSAILPPDKLVKEYLQNSFILYKPKDIVAGDFYWMEPLNNQILFAAADCTGHGVPGAMVSVICNNGLNRSVREYGLSDPGKILDKTREIVIQEFEKSEEEVKDGMDIALCALEGNTLKYAGAHNPLWIVRSEGESESENSLITYDNIEIPPSLSLSPFSLFEIKANKQPIGKFHQPEPYTTHQVELQSGDTLYIFSDGYVDQFGGNKGKKFKVKAFRELLLSIQDQSMEEQRNTIDKAFETWRGDLEQVDDVCIIAVKM